MRALLTHTFRRGAVARVCAVGLACASALALACCGSGGSPSAQALLSETFRSHSPIESGRIDLRLTFSRAGAAASNPALSLRLQGPFQSLGGARLPDFALSLTLASEGHYLQAGATSAGGRLFVALGGSAYVAPPEVTRALQQGFAEAARHAGGKSRSTFAALGIEPGDWIASPHVVGHATVAGADTTHIAASLDLQRFLADTRRLARAGGGLAGQGTSPLSPDAVEALAHSVHSARVDVYTGSRDHVLRRLTLTAAVAQTAQARAALGHLSGGTLSLALEFAEVNRPQRIVAPANPQPIEQLLPALERLLGSSLGGSSLGGSSGSPALTPGA